MSGLNSHAFLGLLTRAMVRGTLYSKRASIQTTKFASSSPVTAATTLAVVTPASSITLGRAAIAFKHAFWRQFVAQPLDDIRTVLYHHHAMLLLDQYFGHRGTRLAAADNNDKHNAPSHHAQQCFHAAHSLRQDGQMQNIAGAKYCAQQRQQSLIIAGQRDDTHFARHRQIAHRMTHQPAGHFQFQQLDLSPAKRADGIQSACVSNSRVRSTPQVVDEIVTSPSRL